MDYILVINPGSTSTKIAVYNGEKVLFTKNLEHDINVVDKFETIASQFTYRKEAIINCLKENNFKYKDLSIVIARGGVGLKPVSSGGFEVNDLMLDRLKNNPVVEHASNLGALIAKIIADEIGIKSYIYDPVATDELMDIARISGMKENPRTSAWHALNSRAMAIKTSTEKGKKIEDLNIIVTHLGGGISSCALNKGRAIDIFADDEGPFSPERAGGVPCNKLIDICYKSGYEYKTMKKKLRGKGGVRDYLGTTDMRKVSEMVKEGNEEAKLITDAMILQISKAIGSLATVLCGEVDYIVITGGIAYDKYIIKEIKKRVGFIGEVIVQPGENEMMALASGAYRILKGEEYPKEYLD